MLTFAVLVWFVKGVLWEPMIKALEQRKQKIADGLAAAERGQHEKDLAEERAKKTLHDAKQEAAEMIANAQKRANQIVDEAKTEAGVEKNRIVAAAQGEIEQEKNRVMQDLRLKVVDLALVGAEKVLEREVNAEAHNEFLTKLSSEL